MERLEAITEWLETPWHFGTWGIAPISVIKLAVLPVLLVVAATMVRRLVLRRLLRNPRIGPGVPNSVATLAYYALIVVGLFAIISTSGIDFRALAAFTGALGLGVGLGLQEIARNFISGLIMLATRPVKLGDRIELEGLEGDVQKIGFYSTVVVTLDDAAVIVPNSLLLQEKLVNWTHTGARRRVRVPVGVHYMSDPEHVRRVLLGVASANPDVVDAPDPDVRLTGFGDSSVDFEMLVWTETLVHAPKVLVSRLNYSVHAALKAEGIVIPYPQRDVHLIRETPDGDVQVKS